LQKGSQLLGYIYQEIGLQAESRQSILVVCDHMMLDRWIPNDEDWVHQI
jgi:hypothetical protein